MEKIMEDIENGLQDLRDVMDESIQKMKDRIEDVKSKIGK